MAHKGQSIMESDTSLPPSSVMTMSFMTPALEQINSEDCGFTIGEATAAPRDNINHTSTKRARRWALRKVCMETIMTDQTAKPPLRHCVCTSSGARVSLGTRRAVADEPLEHWRG